jgi:CRISPR-associated protein Cas2
MLVMILKNVPTSLRGALSRWLIEPETGVFLGNPSSRVRDELWNLAVGKAGRGSVLQMWSYPCPQGYQFRAHNPGPRHMVDFEGLALVRVPRRARKAAQGGPGPDAQAGVVDGEPKLEAEAPPEGESPRLEGTKEASGEGALPGLETELTGEADDESAAEAEADSDGAGPAAR